MRTAGKKLLSFALAALLAVGTLPQAVFAVGETPPIGASGEIIAFEALENSVANQTKPLGTLLEDLDLPEALTATVAVEATPEQNDGVQDSGDPAQEEPADTETDTPDGDTSGEAAVSGNDAPAPAENNEQEGTPSDAQQPDHDALQPEGSGADGSADIQAFGSTQQTVSVPVSEWASEPEYDPQITGTYVFMPVLDEAWSLAAGVEPPVVTVEVIAPAAPVALNAAIQSGTPNFEWNGSPVNVVGFGGKQWNVIGYDGEGVYSTAGDNTVTLLAKNNDFGNAPFRSLADYNGSIYSYNGGALDAAMSAVYDGLTPGEQALILERTDLDAKDNETGTESLSRYVWPLSVNEARSLDLAVREYSETWWLRSPGEDNKLAAVGRDDGDVQADGQNVLTPNYAVRPAFQLDLETVLFASAAAGGKSATVGSLSAAEPPSGAVKFTIKDTNTTNLHLTVANTNAITKAPGETVGIDYTGAVTGEDKYVSAVLMDGDEVLYYGKLSNQESGTASFDVPSGLADGNYTLKLFNEQCNGINQTDFASTPVEIPLTVDSPTPPGPGRPTPGLGDPADGVDIDALFTPGNGIYYGAYEHATSLEDNQEGVVTGRESSPTPVLWRVMGEENGEGYITLLSEYVLDSMVFKTSLNGNNAHNYDSSELRAWLNGTFLDSFANAEQGGMANVDTITNMCNTSGTDVIGDYYPQRAYNNNGSYIDNNNTTQEVKTGPWPINTYNDKVYLPHCDFDDEEVHWGANYSTNSTFADTVATLKNGTSVNWWLRSPSEAGSYLGYILDDEGDVSISQAYVSWPNGVRPAFKLNPESVIFASEIVSSGGTPNAGQLVEDATNYAVSAAAKNYKLTVVDTTLSAGTLAAGGQTMDNSAHPIRTAAPGGTVAVAATGATTGTNLTYKIVDSNRNVVGYGQAADNADLTVTANDLSGGNLVDDSYTVYVWAQENEDINSHRGSKPMYFTLAVDSAFTPGNISITTQPQPQTVTENDSASFSVVVGGTPASYQWQQSTDSGTTFANIDGEIGATYSITATTIAMHGYQYRVLIDCGNAVLVSNAATLTVNAAIETSYTITVQSGGNGTASADKTTATQGETVTLTATPNSGYYFSRWEVVSGGITLSGNRFVMPDNNVTVKAHFSQYNGGGGSDSDDIGSTPTVTIPPAAQPDWPTVGSVSGKTAGTNTQRTFTITDSLVKAALEKAQAQAKAQNRTAYGIGAQLALDTPATAGLTVTFERAALNRLVSTGAKQFEIKGAPISLTLDAKALAELQKQSTDNVTITIKPVTVKGVRNAYDIPLSTVKNGKAVRITSLGSGTATLSIPCTPAKNEAVGGFYAVYVDGKGKVNRIADSSYDANSGSVMFSTDHFSVYGVGYTAPSAKFTDTVKHWAAESIDYVVGRGLLSGTSETTFAPDTAMTRAMLVTALGRLAGVDVKAYTTNSFTDVKADSALRPYIEWAYKKGIVQGIGNSKFAPDRAVTREEIAVIFANFAKATGYKLPVTRNATTYADASSIGSAYKTSVTAMQQAGIMMGGSGNKFNPKSNATRAEVSSMLHRYIKLTIDPATAQGWAKNDAGQWLYYKNGKTVTGTQTIDGVKYYFETTGILKTGWVKDNNGNWHFYSGNILLAGWWDIGANGNNKRYYFDTYGNMISGKWLQIDGKWYYFNADGSLARSTKIDGYEVDENGVRKRK